MTNDFYIRALESTGQISKKAIRNAIKSLKPTKDAKILDVPCGIANHIKWMLEEYPDTYITGVDINENQIRYAKENLLKAGKIRSCEFVTSDMNKLDFPDNTFDVVWCCDGLWPGTKEMGCPAEEPYKILNDMVRVTKNGGKIAILFWSSQKLLPGYPFLEAVLNTTISANRPLRSESNPELHIMCTPAWLRKAGLKNIQVKSFLADISAPFNEKDKENMGILFNMFWAQAEQEVPKDIWEKFRTLINPDSDKYIMNSQAYTGLLTYTMFTGEVVK